MDIKPSSTSRTAAALAALALVACGDGSDAAEAGGVAHLGEPTATFAEDFGNIQSVREMPDGRVLVADPFAKALYVVDLGAGTRAVIGSEGEGPGEYLQPDAVWPLPADSTLLVDLGNGRLVALGPDFSFGPTTPLTMGQLPAGLVLAVPQAVDALGRIYARSFGGGFGTTPPDSAAILRIDRGTQTVDTAGTFKLEDEIRTTSQGGRGISVSPIPLSPEDAWGVAPDGSVVIARASEYRVDWIAPDGSLTPGPAVPYEPLPLGTAEKEEWDRERSRNVGIQMMVRVSNGAAEMTVQRGGRGGGSGETDFSVYQWPETLPAVHAGRIRIDRQVRAWVRRYVGAGGLPTYDVFDRSGQRVGTVELGDDRQVVGFGAGVVYVVAFDQFDLNYLERYAMPEL